MKTGRHMNSQGFVQSWVLSGMDGFKVGRFH